MNILTANRNSQLPKKPTYEQALAYRKEKVVESFADEVVGRVKEGADTFRQLDDTRTDTDRRPDQIQIGGKKESVLSAGMKALRVFGTASVVPLTLVAFAVNPVLGGATLLGLGGGVIKSWDEAWGDQPLKLGVLRTDNEGEVQEFQARNEYKSFSMERTSKTDHNYTEKAGRWRDNNVTIQGNEIQLTTKENVRSESLQQLPTLNRQAFQEQFEFKLSADGEYPDLQKLSKKDATLVSEARKTIKSVSQAVSGLKNLDQGGDDLDIDENRVVVASYPFAPGKGTDLDHTDGLYGALLEADSGTGDVISASITRRGHNGVGFLADSFAVRKAPGTLSLALAYQDHIVYENRGAEETFKLNGCAVVRNKDTGLMTVYEA